jgi:uncharacterized protein YecA (UPF0149 family)
VAVLTFTYQPPLSNYHFLKLYGHAVVTAAPNLLREPFDEPGRNDPCPCKSGVKSKRCCYS